MTVSDPHCAKIGNGLVPLSKPTFSPARCARAHIEFDRDSLTSKATGDERDGTGSSPVCNDVP